MFASFAQQSQRLKFQGLILEYVLSQRAGSVYQDLQKYICSYEKRTDPVLYFTCKIWNIA